MMRGRVSNVMDVNKIAKRVVDAATGNSPPAAPDTRNQAAVELSKLGSSKGGKARAAALTKKKRIQIAKKAAKARWGKKSDRRSFFMENKMGKENKSFKIGRNSETGKLESVKKAQQHPKTSQVEHMPKRGRGDTGKKK